MAFTFNRRRRQDSEGKRRGPADPEIMQLYGSFWEETEQIMLGFVQIQKDVEDPMGDAAFRVRRSNHQAAIEKKFEKPPQGAKEQSQLWSAFDGWFKGFVEREYGYDESENPSDWVKKHGGEEDWVHHAIYLVMPGQVRKHNHQVRWCEFVGVQPADVIRSKQRFKELVYEVAIKKVVEGKPNKEKMLAAGKTHADYVNARADYDNAVREFAPNSKGRIEIEVWLGLRKRQFRQEGPGWQQHPPQKFEAEQLRESIAEDIERLVGLRKQLVEQTNSGADLAVLNGTMGSLKEVQDRIAASKTKLKELEGSKPAGADERLQRAANIVASEPVIPSEPMGGKPAVSGDATDAKVKAGDTDAKVEALKADIARLETEIEKQARSAEGHRAKAQELYGKADSTRDAKNEDYRKAASRLEMEAEREESSAVTAEGLVKKAQTEIDRINGRIEELTKAAAKSPDEKKSKRKKSDVAPTGTVVTPPAEAKTPAPQAANDSPPKLTGNPRDDLAAQIAYWGAKGNDVMVNALTPALTALGG